MSTVKIVVWDNIGNTILGVRPWDVWDDRTQNQLLAEDPQAKERVQGFEEILDGYEVELVWLYDDEKSKLGFRELITGFAPRSRPMSSLDQLRDEMRDADFLIVHKEQLPAEVLESASKLKLIQHLGQDYRGVPVSKADSLGIPVAATPLVNYIAVAEHGWALILNFMKRLPAIRSRMIDRTYIESWGRIPGLTLARDQTLGLLGFGEIARPMARIARALDMNVIYWDMVRFPDLEHELGASFVDWDTMFRQSDVLSVQLALNEQTRGIIGERELSLMKHSSLFMNTGRGKLVDQNALTEAVRTRQIGGLALDVFEEEPLPVDDPLHELHESDDYSVTLTPHCAWQSPWTWIRDSQELWFNIRRVLQNERPEFLVPGSGSSSAD